MDVWLVSPDLAGTPAGSPPKSVQVKLADTIAPGRYPYVCLLHPFMGGAVDVMERETQVPSPAQVSQAAEAAQAEAVTDATALGEPQAVAAGGETAVNAGWGDKVTAINQFGRLRSPSPPERR